jgi:hypothetical protein
MIPTTQTIRSLAQLLLGWAAFLSSPGAWSSEAGWELQIKEADISVYTRPIDGSPFHEVKATANISAPVTRVAELMGDGNGCAEWRAMCESSEVIEAVSEHERYVYLVLDMPWPAQDRDMVMHSETSIDPESFSATVDLKTASSKHPPGGYIRAESSGQFVITALSPEQVEFTYIMHTDLGGDLPAGAVNSRLAEGTFDDLKRLIELAEG